MTAKFSRMEKKVALYYTSNDHGYIRHSFVFQIVLHYRDYWIIDYEETIHLSAEEYIDIMGPLSYDPYRSSY